MKAPRKRVADIIAAQSLLSGFGRQQALSAAAYLLSERRTNELDSLLRDVRAAWAEEGFVEVIAQSAHKLSDQDRSDISIESRRVYPDAKQIKITEIISPALVGGVCLEFASRQLDMSVRSELNKFKTLAVNGKD